MGIIVRGLQKEFGANRGRSDVKAVDDLSLEVEDGELLVILGPSGSGKTTLLRCIAGLERADSGEIEVDGKIVFSSEKKIWVPPERRGVSMVFQSYALWPHMTVFNNVRYPLKVMGVPKAEAAVRVQRVLDMVGCGHLADRHPGEISGGQQQRIAVARAIVGGARVVLFDEPLSAVDARVREDLRRELVELQRELGFASVYITHDQTEAMAIGHRVAVLSGGKILQISSPRELYSRPTSSDVAQFMGATNAFEGTVTSSKTAGNLIVASPIGAVEAASEATVAVGSTATVIFRPEYVRLSAARPAEAANVWFGSVESSLFLGHATEYRVLVGTDQTLIVRSTDQDVLDGEVWLHVPPADVRFATAEVAR
ncbi:MAG: ABC transporter ATP-binding protein, partial [Actinomycetota bacterium]